MSDYTPEMAAASQERLNDFMDTSREMAEQFADDPEYAADMAKFKAGQLAAREQLMKEDPAFRARHERSEAIQAEINARQSAEG